MSTKPMITHSSGVVATWLGVSSAAVSNWMTRYPQSIPVPDAVIVYPSGDEQWGGVTPRGMGSMV